jgi:CRP-like cAMP-binding protein
MHKNRLLEILARSQADALRNRLTSIDFVHGDVLAEAGSLIERVIFPRSGLVSLVVDLADGERIEAAMVGHDGAVGGAAAFGAMDHLCTGFAQLPGSAWVMKVADLMDFAAADRDFRAALFAQEQFLLAQAQQTAACNAKHNIPQRLCSWLLRAQDIVATDELLLTQEHLAQMLGVQRASVSMFASQLQDKGLIHYRRGRVHIVDPMRLASEACECHANLRQQRVRLFNEPAEEVVVPERALVG